MGLETPLSEIEACIFELLDGARGDHPDLEDWEFSEGAKFTIRVELESDDPDDLTRGVQSLKSALYVSLEISALAFEVAGVGGGYDEHERTLGEVLRESEFVSPEDLDITILDVERGSIRASLGVSGKKTSVTLRGKIWSAITSISVLCTLTGFSMKDGIEIVKHDSHAPAIETVQPAVPKDLEQNLHGIVSGLPPGYTANMTISHDKVQVVLKPPPSETDPTDG